MESTVAEVISSLINLIYPTRAEISLSKLAFKDYMIGIPAGQAFTILQPYPDRLWGPQCVPSSRYRVLLLRLQLEREANHSPACNTDV
jgi:hypothetical protein